MMEGVNNDITTQWQLDELEHLTVEYTDLTEVQAFDARRELVKNIQRVIFDPEGKLK